MLSTALTDPFIDPLLVCLLAFSYGSKLLRVGREIDRRRGEELKLIYDHKLGRRRASTAVDIEKGDKWRNGGREDGCQMRLHASTSGGILKYKDLKLSASIDVNCMQTCTIVCTSHRI